MSGITRINITDKLNGRGANRFYESRLMQPAANALYRKIWYSKGIPLLPGDELVNCTLAEFTAGYDYALGIDVIFNFENGASGTLQEKFLPTDFYTLTVEYMNDPVRNIKGDWFTMKSQYYFVGYYNKDRRDRGFTKWVMVNWPLLQMSSVSWRENKNKHDGAKANFKYIKFDEIPKNCITSIYTDGIQQLDMLDAIGALPRESRLHPSDQA